MDGLGWGQWGPLGCVMMCVCVWGAGCRSYLASPPQQAAPNPRAAAIAKCVPCFCGWGGLVGWLWGGFEPNLYDK